MNSSTSLHLATTTSSDLATARPEPKSDIVTWLPAIFSSIAILFIGVTLYAALFASFSAWDGSEEPVVFDAIFVGAAVTWAALMIGAVATTAIALCRGNFITLIGLLPMALAASPLLMVMR